MLAPTLMWNEIWFFDSLRRPSGIRRRAIFCKMELPGLMMQVAKRGAEWYNIHDHLQ